jgi:hypothetical protein
MNAPARRYEIRVEETLDGHWSQWLSEMEIIPLQGCAAGTLLRGSLPDQAALFGLLARLRDLNLTLVEVARTIE